MNSGLEQMLGVVNSAEQLRALYNHTVCPIDLPSPCNLQIFQHGVQPLLEDDANRFGCKLYFRLHKGHSSRMWEDMLLALIGGQFHGCADVQGTRCEPEQAGQVTEVFFHSLRLRQCDTFASRRRSQ